MQIFKSKLYLPDEREPAGNAYCILGFIDGVMSKAYEATHEDERFNKEARAAYQKDATSGDYDHLRDVSLKILNLVNDYDGVIL